MKSDLDKHIEKHLKDKDFKIHFEKAQAKRKIVQKIALLRFLYQLFLLHSKWRYKYQALFL